MRRADHAVQVRPDASLAALVEGMAGGADLLGGGLAGGRIGRCHHLADRRQALGLAALALGGLRHVDLDGWLLERRHVHQRLADEAGYGKGDPRDQNGGDCLVDLHRIHVASCPLRDCGPSWMARTAHSVR